MIVSDESLRTFAKCRIKVPLTQKYFFRLNKSLHLFETRRAVLRLFQPNIDFL